MCVYFFVVQLSDSLLPSDRSPGLSLDCYLELDEYNLCVKKTVEWWSCQKSDRAYCCIQLELRNCLKNLSPKCEATALVNEVSIRDGDHRYRVIQGLQQKTPLQRLQCNRILVPVEYG